MHPNELRFFPNQGFKFFLLCCAIWWIVGLIAILNVSAEDLFKHFNLNHSDWGDAIMVWVTKIGEAPIMLIFFSIFIFIYRKEIKWYHIVPIVLGIALPALINNILKQVAGFPRPLNLYAGEQWVHTVADYKNNRNNSFPSGHTAGAFAFMGMIAALLKPKQFMVGGILFLIALFTGFSRIYLAQHFFLDVVFGSMVGTVLLFIILFIWNKYVLSKKQFIA